MLSLENEPLSCLEWLSEPQTATEQQQIVKIEYFTGVLETVLHSTVFMWWNLGFPATAPVIFIGLLHLKKRSTKKKTWWKDC